MGASANIVVLVAWTAVFVVFSYAVCGIPFGLIIAKAMGHVDVRSTGSGNIGTTNVARSVGKAAAGLTLLCDLGKGLACMLFSRFMLSLLVFGVTGFAAELAIGEGLVAMTAVFDACVLGHIFSPYLNFRGGKGIAVGFGAALGLWWPVGLGLAVVFALFAVPSRYVSLGSVLAAVSLPIQCAAWGFDGAAVAVIAAAALVVVWAHRANIVKLVHGDERKFGFRKGGETDTEGKQGASGEQLNNLYATDPNAPAFADEADASDASEGHGDAAVGAHFEDAVNEAQPNEAAEDSREADNAEGDAR